MYVDIPFLKALKKEALRSGHSVFYPLIEERLSVYEDVGDSAFFPEFMFFEPDYYAILIYLLENSVQEPVVDIGCQFGFQSELFEGWSYTGIDNNRSLDGRRFNDSKPGVEYICGTFPDVEIDLTDKVAISNMSLGYFACGRTEKDLAEHLAPAKMVFMRAPKKLTDALRGKFISCQELLPSSNPKDYGVGMDCFAPLYCFSNPITAF